MSHEQQDTRPGAAALAEHLPLVPPRYRPLAHLAATPLIGLVLLILAFANVEAFGWTGLAAVLLTIVYANLVEWCAHRWLLHRRRRFWEVLYDRHVPMHHMIYRHGSMAVTCRREWFFVLMPAKGVLGIVILAIPLALALGALIGHDVGWIFLTTAGLYAVSYEMLHLCYHLRSDVWVMRIPFLGRVLRALSRHHARHHHVQLMQKWNFNVTVPLWDFILRTHYPRNKPLPEP
jgi:hypothetical protein